MRRIPLLLMIIVPLLALAAPARAGGWAVTFMDPAPTGMRPNTTYTLGFWLLQHGTHPYEGANLGEVGLEFTSGKKRVLFSGVRLKEPAHYAAAISLPPGTWQVKGVQGWFSPYEIGTLALPGDLRLAPVPEDLKQAIAAQAPQQNYWGEIRPPGFPQGTATPQPVTPPSATPQPAAAPSAPLGTTTVAVVEADSWWRPPYTPVALLGLVLLAVMAYRLRRR
ncbi:hypothetical protein SAMN05216276_100380 [Streptosporangium subroseum]|uniref:Uncharacterized protein n=1 Tax=Streptosporangium subroseum TaxID=106412 RepID=A0A239BCP5_9ACTN|nr:hypothetical protein [Streptosporangium subroseum]SNS04944.1 hypothetical protein SAMN05216276_100380 [Streptosporangium subroseum]